MLIFVNQTADIYKFIQLMSFVCSLRLCSDGPIGILGTFHVDLCKSNTDIILKHFNFKWFNKTIISHFTPNSFLGVNFIFVCCNLLGKSHLAQNIQPCNCVTRIIGKDKIFSICVF